MEAFGIPVATTAGNFRLSKRLHLLSCWTKIPASLGEENVVIVSLLLKKLLKLLLVKVLL